jgi:hypothetical protein
MANEFDLSGFGQALRVAPSESSAIQPTSGKRQADRMAILQDEMAKARQRLASGDQSAQRDIDALTREMGGKTSSQPMVTSQPQSQNESFDLGGFSQALLANPNVQPEQVGKPSSFVNSKQKYDAQLEEAFKKIPGYQSLEAGVMGAGGAISKSIGGLQQLIGKGVGMIAPETGQAISENALKNVRQTEGQLAPYEQARPIATTVGGIAGAIANPINKLIPGGTATGMMGLAQGAGQGALSNVLTTPVTDENKAFLTAKLEQAFAGGVGGAAGTAIARAPGALAEPFKKALGSAEQQAVDFLRKSGVPIDVAQATGSEFLKRTKAASFDNPHTAGKAIDFADMQKAAYNKAVAKTMGEDASAITPDVLQAAKTRLGNNYDDIALRNNIHLDDQLTKNLSSIRSEAEQILNPEQFNIVQKQINNIIQKAEEQGGGLHGEQYQSIKKVLDKLSGGRDTDVGSYARELKETLLDGLTRTAKATGNEADVKLLKETNRQYSNMKKIEDVVLKNEFGNVSPSLLNTSLATKSKRYSFYQDDPELANLARAGKMVLEQKLPNSGSVARLLASSPVYAGGKALYQGSAQAAMMNPTAAKYIEQGLPQGAFRSVLEAPQQLGQMLPQYMQKPGAISATALRELINQRNLGVQ